MYWGMKSYFNTTSNLGEMSVFNNKGFFISRIEDYYKKANKDIKQAEKKAILYSIIAAIFSRGIMVASVVYLIYNITIGNSGIGNLTFMFYVITNFRSGLSNLFNAVGKSYEDVLYIKDFIYLMELKNVVVKNCHGASSSVITKIIDQMSHAKIRFATRDAKS
jgi:predicted tellurium resistance membrane protein TerC